MAGEQSGRAEARVRRESTLVCLPAHYRECDSS